MAQKILITPKSFRSYKEKTYPLLLEKGYEIVENNLGRTMTEAEIIEAAGREVAGIIIGVDPLPAAVLEKCRDLKAISKYGVGMDNIDLVRAAELGIKVKNALGSNSVSVAELAIGLMFTLSRSLSRVASGVRNGSWDRYMGCELTGKRLGLIGGGQIGREVAKRARGLEMSVAVYDPYLKDEGFLEKYRVIRAGSLEEIFKTSDFISLHLPATGETRHIINRAAFRLMKPDCFLINTSRGELVDEEALCEALAGGVIAGAAQDVFSAEPPDKDEKLLKLPNFILTSHIGAFTREAVERMAMVSTMNLLEMLG